MALPLALETRWRHQDQAAGYAQPEVPVIERAGSSLVGGGRPVPRLRQDGRLVGAVKGVPAFE